MHFLNDSYVKSFGLKNVRTLFYMCFHDTLYYLLTFPKISNCNIYFSLRGILPRINAQHVYTLLKCLELSNAKAKEFDSRPGLKFLTQKVGNLCKSANLYTQANTSEVVQIIVLIELCLDGIDRYGIEPKTMKDILATIEPEEGEEDCITDDVRGDLPYLEKFLRKLHVKWETYVLG